VPDIVVHLVAAAVYLGLAGHFWNTRWRHAAPVDTSPANGQGLLPWERTAILVPLALHAWLIYATVFAAPALSFGFAQALSAMLWLAVLIYWLESLFFRLDGMQPIVLGAAAASALLPAFFPGRPIEVSAELRLHLTLAIVAYSVFTIAILHAVLLAVADRLLHTKMKSPAAHAELAKGAVANLPPLLTIEKMLFRLIAVAFVLLTLTLASGMTLSESRFGRALRFNHETVFALLSWITFAALLAGRFLYGWRGRTALRWTITGFVMLVLANIGTAFVLEVVLQRQ